MKRRISGLPETPSLSTLDGPAIWVLEAAKNLSRSDGVVGAPGIDMGAVPVRDGLSNVENLKADGG